MMEYIPYGNLYDLIHNKNEEIGWAAKLKIATDIAAGMSFLHNMDPPFLHRDLKSPNILVLMIDIDFVNHSLIYDHYD